MKSAPDAIASRQGKITGSQQRSQLRINNILEAAQHILITEGFHSLSLRKIAQHLDISNGNVTYYFRNKDVLLRALIEDMLTRYDNEFEVEAAKFSNAPEKRLSAYFQYLIADAQLSGSRNFFYQLWGLSTHNPIAEKLRDEVYQHFLSQLSIRLREYRPDMSDETLKNKSFLLMSLMEGLNVLLGSSKDFLGQFDNIESYLHQQAMDIAQSP